MAKLEKRKNILELINGFKLFIDKQNDKNYKLVITGDTGYESYSKLVHDLANPLINEKYKIEILGKVSDEKMGEILSRSIGLIYPSSYEAFGLPPLEAISANVPVISSNTGWISSNLQGKYVEIKQISPDEIAKCMEILIVNYNEFLLKTNEAKVIIDQKISDSKLLEKWKNVIINAVTNQ